MIVNDDKAEIALSYLNMDPHPLALARKDVTDAENKARQAYARAFLGAEGSVEARKAMAEVSSEYMAAKNDESHAALEFERHRARVKGAEMLLEIWRSEQANVRAAERVR
jgi:hypothetical protein